MDMSVDHVGHSVESVGHGLDGWRSALAAERAGERERRVGIVGRLRAAVNVEL
jgi:hypothetical protein